MIHYSRDQSSDVNTVWHGMIMPITLKHIKLAARKEQLIGNSYVFFVIVSTHQDKIYSQPNMIKIDGNNLFRRVHVLFVIRVLTMKTTCEGIKKPVSCEEIERYLCDTNQIII